MRALAVAFSLLLAFQSRLEEILTRNELDYQADHATSDAEQIPT